MHAHAQFCFLSRRTLIALAAVLILPPALLSAAEAAPKTNFVVILCDDMGYGDLGCFGNPTIQTPCIDRLATEGMKLTNCYASAAVCSPSRCGLLTGRTPYRIGIYEWLDDQTPMHLRRSEITVATLLQRAGYDTCHVGKWHCNSKFNTPEQPQPSDHGFDYWFSTRNNAAPSHRNPDNFVRNGQPLGPLQGFSSALVASEAIGWLEQRPDKSRPFFLYVCFHEPHEPIDSPEEYVKRYPQATQPGEALYYANITHLDFQVGRLLATLDRLGARQNTLVFLTSDNGPETLNRYPAAWRSHGSPGPLRGMKSWLYEGGFREPGILRWPGKIAAGETCDEPVCNLDVLPTFCAIAGVPLPNDRVIDGDSFLPILEHQPIRRKHPLYWQYDKALGWAKLAMRDGDWKILADAELSKFELYNLKQDLGEQHDLADAEPERLRAMAAALQKLHDEIKAEGPIWPMVKKLPKGEKD